MLRGGITLALLSGGVKLLVGVMRLNSELVIYRRANNTGKQEQHFNTWQLCNAYKRNDDMTFLLHRTYYKLSSNLNGVRE